MNIENILNRLTFVPKNSKLYPFWKFFMSMISLIQTIMYALFVGWGFHHDLLNWRNITLILIEFIYLINITIQFFIAYDIEGGSV